jgi:cytochrome c biogenesis protein CcmG/thiol:disulfide interchange protein DsbE
VKQVFKPLLLSLALAGGALALPPRAVADMPAALGEISGRVVLVDFWASWCAPCRRSFPWMNSMLERYGDQGLQIIGVNVDKERSLAAEFLAETPADFELRYDPAGALAERFDVQAMPSSFLLDPEGKVIATHFGFRFADADEYEASIVAALRGAGAAPQQ